MFSDPCGTLLIPTLMLIACLAPIGCASQDDAPAARVSSDLSAPKPAALTFLRAIAAGDAHTAQAASAGTPAQKECVVAMVSLVNGLRHYDQALLGRFGQEAVPADVDLRQALQSMTQDPITHVEGGIVSEANDAPLIYPAVGGMKLAAHAPMHMRKEGKIWKVDLAAMSDEPRYSPEVGRRYRAAGKALSDAARHIRAGRYRTLGEAEQAVAQDMDFNR